MVKINIIELLEKNNKTKYWLCKHINMTSRNLNRISISFKYIEEFCLLLNCTLGELITITEDEYSKLYQ